MKNIKLPRNIIVGRKVLEKVLPMTSDFDSILVVSGKKTSKIAGNKVGKLLDCEKIIVQRADFDDVRLVEKAIKTNRINLAVAVGGGTVIDVTKLAAYNAGIDYISVPTTCSNDGMCSPMVSIRNDSGSFSIKANPPMGVVADTKILRKSPYKFTSSGIGDIIAKYTAVRDWKLGNVINGEYYGDYASALSLMVAEMALNYAREIRKRSEVGMGVLLEALISSGAAMGIAGSSRPASGSEHKFSHALDIIADFPSMHGLQCGVGTIVMSYLHGLDWQRVKNALETAKCPVRAKGLKVDKDIILEALLKARDIRPNRYTVIEHIKLDKKIAEHALDATGVI